MDFDEAIRSHLGWKIKLSGYLRNPDISLKVADIQVDNNCALGHWIYGDGDKYKQMAEYGKLKYEHAKFHMAAGEVVRNADSGQTKSEEVALGAKSDYAAASDAVVRAILDMKKKTKV